MQLAARVADWIIRWQADAVFVDEGGVGGGVVDRLHQFGFRIVQGVNFGGRSGWGRKGEKASNKRSEMRLSARNWLKGGSLPDDPALVAELTGPSHFHDARNQIVLERKEDMKKRWVKLGNPNGTAALWQAGKGGAALRATVATNADRFAVDLGPVLADIRASGHTSLRAGC